MGDFISWVETEDGKLHYLTDKEVFGRNANKDFKGYIGNDFLGHWAIRKHFSLGDEGKNHKVRDFWNTEKLPPELAEKLKSIKEFDKHWGKMFQNYFQNDLTYIIRYAPNKWAAKAWKQLLKQGPSTDNLKDIIRYAPNKWAAKAWKQFLKHGFGDENFKYIMDHAPNKWRVKAWKQLLKRDPSYNNLRYIIKKGASNRWKAKARKILNSRYSRY